MARCNVCLLWPMLGDVLDAPHDCPLNIYDLMRGCWEYQPMDRLTANDMCKLLDVLEPIDLLRPQDEADEADDAGSANGSTVLSPSTSRHAGNATIPEKEGGDDHRSHPSPPEGIHLVSLAGTPALQTEPAAADITTPTQHTPRLASSEGKDTRALATSPSLIIGESPRSRTTTGDSVTSFGLCLSDRLTSECSTDDLNITTVCIFLLPQHAVEALLFACSVQGIQLAFERGLLWMCHR